MSTFDALRRTTEDETDFYQSLPCQVKCLCNYVDFDRKVIIDAGSGKQIIANTISELYPQSVVLTSEKNPCGIHNEEILFDIENPGIERDAFPPAVFGDFLEVSRKVDSVVSNAPYSMKDDFISHGLELAPDVYMLFPLQIINYIEICENWLDSPFYMGRISMYPKVILNPRGEYIQGGNTGYAWFHWSTSQLNRKTPVKYEIFADIRKFM